MPLTREQKEEVVADLMDKLSRQKASVFVDLSGMSIGEQNELRKRLRKQDIEMIVARKSLIEIALKEVGADTETVAAIQQPLALVIGYGDVVGPAKTVKLFEKEFEHPEILGGLLQLKNASIEEIETLAELPGKDELRAKVVGSLAAPMQGFVGVLEGTIRSFLSVLQQRSQESQ